MERIFSNVKKWGTRAPRGRSARGGIISLLPSLPPSLPPRHENEKVAGQRQRDIAVSPFFHKTSINAHRTGETRKAAVFSLSLQSYNQINLLSNLVRHHLSDGNDKIEERVKEKQKKDKEHQKPPNRKKKVDLTFDYDPEKECE